MSFIFEESYYDSYDSSSESESDAIPIYMSFLPAPIIFASQNEPEINKWTLWNPKDILIIFIMIKDSNF